VVGLHHPALCSLWSPRLLLHSGAGVTFSPLPPVGCELTEGNGGAA